MYRYRSTIYNIIVRQTDDLTDGVDEEFYEQRLTKTILLVDDLAEHNVEVKIAAVSNVAGE